MGSADLDGAARVVDATVDMGAYEYDENTYDSDSDGLTDSEEVANGLDPLASNIGVDSDGDGLLDVDEVANGYDPLVSDFTPEHYVSLSGLHIFPYTNWTTAATNIQSAVAVAASNDTVWVANGTYLLASEITVAKDITIQSMNGPGAAIVDGNGVVRCFNLGTNACTVSGFTITNGLATTETIPANIGGGIYCGNTMPVVSNCTISGNTASGYSNVDFDTGYGYGGGMYVGTAYNCIISGNTASGSSSDGSGSGYGGGMYGGAAYNCIISGNTASGYSGSGSGSGVGGGIVWFSGGEAYNCTISGNTASGSSSSLAGGIGGGTNYNCIIWYNNASVGADAVQSTFYFGCSPDATNGMNGNITDSPFFADKDNGDYRLLYGSACINAGSNVYAAGISTDLDGGMRIVDATVDMGAYEYDATTYDSDDDTRLDADEVLMGLDPNYNENAAIAYGEAQVANNPESYGLYTASAVLDLGVGDIGVMVTNGNAELWLQMWQSEDLVAWTNAGPPVLWLFPVGPSNSFYRVRADP